MFAIATVEDISLSSSKSMFTFPTGFKYGDYYIYRLSDFFLVSTDKCESCSVKRGLNLQHKPTLFWNIVAEG